jgi:2-C-methyl-D-erythritol 4-phosphate cytidylyltransferase
MRFKQKIPKQIYKINNKLMIEHSIISMKKLDKIIIMTNHKCFKIISNLSKLYNNIIVLQTASVNRETTLYNAISYIKKNNNYHKINNIIIHDSARPYINYKHINNLLKYMKHNIYVQYCMKLTNGLGFIDDKKIKPVDRDNYIELCTPICLNANFLFNNYDKCYNDNIKEYFEILNINRLPYKILYDDYKYLKKITYSTDL